MGIEKVRLTISVLLKFKADAATSATIIQAALIAERNPFDWWMQFSIRGIPAVTVWAPNKTEPVVSVIDFGRVVGGLVGLVKSPKPIDTAFFPVKISTDS